MSSPETCRAIQELCHQCNTNSQTSIDQTMPKLVKAINCKNNGHNPKDCLNCSLVTDSDPNQSCPPAST